MTTSTKSAHRLFLALAVLLSGAASLRAESPVTLVVDSMVYADNTEFKANFRVGDTVFGTWLRSFASAKLGDRAELRAGVLLNRRFGSQETVDLIRPILALSVGTPQSHMVLGTLETVRSGGAIGPDRAGPHGLLPPIQIEILSFDRPYEAGLQWLFDRGRLRHDVWLDWQLVANPSRREVFDAGTCALLRLARPVSLGLQLHEVHHGGQIAKTGTVGDSFVSGAGLILSSRLPPLDRASLEVYGLKSLHHPDRSDRSTRIAGSGVFVRGSLEKSAWRLHAIHWRGTRYTKVEGDPNYFSFAADAQTIAGGRSYEEAGLTRLFTVAPAVTLEASARLHRIAGRTEYSYRILARAGASWLVKH